MGQRALKWVNKGFIPVRQLVPVEEISGGSRLHWYLFDWYGENQHQNIFQGYDRGVNEGFSWLILHIVEEKACGARGKAAICYWLQVQFPEGLQGGRVALC